MQALASEPELPVLPPELPDVEQVDAAAVATPAEPVESAWTEWLGRAHELLGPPAPTGPVPLAELVVLTDQQVKYLGGERTALQSLTSDAAVDVAIRPIALDLFGFSSARVLRLGVEQFRELHPDRPVTYVDTGDVVDLACRKELVLTELEWAGAGPDLIAPGNHDFNYAGNFRKSTDFFGITGLTTRGSLRREAWAPSCAVSLDAAHATRPLPPADRLALEQTVILEKDAFAEWWAALSGISLDDVVVPLRSAKRGGYRLRDDRKTRKWEDDDVVDTFWHAIDPDHAVAAVRLESICEGAPGNTCREAGRGWLLLSVRRLAPDSELWLIAADSTDQTHNNLQVPGAYSSYSHLQARLLMAWMNQRRAAASEERPARFAIAMHFPLSDLVRKKNLRRSKMVDVFGSDDVLFATVGHTHVPGVQMADYDTIPSIARRRRVPLAQIVAGSVLDHPVGGARISVVEEKIGQRSVVRPVAYNFQLSAPDTAPSPPVALQLDHHLHAVTGYRAIGARIKEWKWRRMLNRGRFSGALRRLALHSWVIEQDDTLLVMEQQFEEMVGYLDSVAVLLALDAEQDPELENLAAEVRALTDAATSRLSSWKANSPIAQPSALSPADFATLDLFQWSCAPAVEINGSNRFFTRSSNCTEAIQTSLRRVPSDTLAFEFMLRLAVAAAQEEYCTGPHVHDMDTLPPECQSEWFVGPYTPL